MNLKTSEHANRIMYTIKSFLVCLVLEIVVCANSLPPTTIVSTTSGKVQGVINTTADGIEYSSFKGIRYAEKPVRFQAPQPKKPSTEIIQGIREGPNCLQVSNDEKKLLGSEDCLYLNVYTPLTNLSQITGKLKPVFFWIHGGSFTSGSGDSCKFGPGGLIAHDIVVVTINYRLGALGWILTSDKKIPGDAGLKDQLLALKWVQQNIKRFGGDPKRVTLVGQSAGSVSVNAQGLSNRAKGLFHQQINFSGTVCNVWGYNNREEAQATADSFAELLNNQTSISNQNEFIRILMQASAEELIIKTHNITKTFPAMKVGMDEDSASPILDKCYHDIYKSGDYNIVPTMMGMTKNEALLFTKSVDDIIAHFKKYMTSLGQTDIAIFAIISNFVGRPITKFADISVETLIDIFSQVFFHTGIDYCQRQMCRARNSNVPIYYYFFEFDGKEYSFHYQAAKITELQGVAHEDELMYIFQECPAILKYPKDPNHPVNVKRRQMTTLVANFVKYGNPTPKGKQDPLLGVTWPNSCNEGHHLSIGENLTVKYQRPIGTISEVLIPICTLKGPLNSDCIIEKIYQLG